MPNPSKGPRLYLRRAAGRSQARWIIRDGDKFVSTGCAPGERGEAEQRLAAYIADKYRPDRSRGRDPSQIAIADVLNIYLTDVAPTKARPHEFAQRMRPLIGYFADKTLEDINGAACREYARKRGSQSMAKRELEDLRAAVNHHRREGLCNAIVEIVVPEKAEPRDRWLTKREAAALLWCAWSYRELQKGKPTDRRSRRHIARFALVGLYTGRRAGAICAASVHREIGRGFVDLDRGTFEPARGRRQTKKRQPAIRLPDRLLAHMRRWHRLGLCSRAIVEWNGEPVATVRKAFARAVADAKLTDVTPHTLRHTAVTWAMQGGADLWDAAAMFGMTVETLERVYGHHRPGAGESVARALMSKRAG